MSTVSGMSAAHAKHARDLLAKQARVMVLNKNKIAYSQGPNRMVGIRQKLTISLNEYPKTCDCSSTSYWMLWDAIRRTYGVRDLVANCNWDPNGTIFTGTMYKHGKAVVHDANLKIGDLIFYGDQGGGVPEHVAMCMGGGLVFSHGSMGGPYILKLDYRNDRRMSRRYI